VAKATIHARRVGTKPAALSPHGQSVDRLDGQASPHSYEFRAAPPPFSEPPDRGSQEHSPPAWRQILNMLIVFTLGAGAAWWLNQPGVESVASYVEHSSGSTGHSDDERANVAGLSGLQTRETIVAEPPEDRTSGSQPVASQPAASQAADVKPGEASGESGSKKATAPLAQATRTDAAQPAQHRSGQHAARKSEIERIKQQAADELRARPLIGRVAD
jgi:hypothetical protein